MASRKSKNWMQSQITENKLVEIYGHAAQTALDLAKDRVDLRQIVKE